MSYFYNRENLFNFRASVIGPKGPIGPKGDEGDTTNFFDINGNLNMNEKLIYNLEGITYTGRTLNIDTNTLSSSIIKLNVNEVEIGNTIDFAWNILRIRIGATTSVSGIVYFANPIGYTTDDNNPQWLIGRKYNHKPTTDLSIWRFIGSHQSNSLTIDNQNRLGIGNQFPSASLDIYAGLGNTTYLIAGTGVTTNRLSFFSSGSITQGAVHNINAPSVDGTIIFQTANVERLRIANNGNIGIGITDGTLGATLDINGSSIRIRQSNPPGSTTSAGNFGEIRWDDNNLYIRVSNQWKAIPLQNF